MVGVDLSAKAIELALTKATERGVEARFLVADALLLVDLGERFDTVLDCGLFHVLDDDEASSTSTAWLRWFLRVAAITCSVSASASRVTGTACRVTQSEIRTSFSEGWEVECIEPTVIDLTWDPAGALAWQAAVTRKCGGHTKVEAEETLPSEPPCPSELSR